MTAALAQIAPRYDSRSRRDNSFIDFLCPQKWRDIIAFGLTDAAGRIISARSCCRHGGRNLSFHDQAVNSALDTGDFMPFILMHQDMMPAVSSLPSGGRSKYALACFEK